MVQLCITILISLAVVARAINTPTYSGWSMVWQDTFAGSAGTKPDTDKWNIITGDIGVNNELQVYTTAKENVQLTGDQTLKLQPLRDASKPKGWTSGRLESKYTFTPAANKITRIEARIKFGKNPLSAKQGIWPAFWMLGDSMRHGTAWPRCGEIDILETINGQLTGHGTVHCDVYPGGICNEGTGIGASTGFPNEDWHTWRVQVNRQNSDWTKQKITWWLDGKQFHQVTGARIGNQNIWKSLAQKPLYIILNVAVGGTWPGNPNSATKGGAGSRMEVDYVAHYVSQ